MVVKIIKCIGYYLTAASPWGAIYIWKRKKKRILLLICIAATVIILRKLNRNLSSRYLSSLIIYCSVVLAFSFDFIITNYSKEQARRFTLLNIILIIGVNTIDSFVSFNNTYILDIKDHISFISKKEKDLGVVSYQKEYRRLLENTPFDLSSRLLIKLEECNDLTDYYNTNAFYSKKLLYIIDDKNLSEINPTPDKKLNMVSVIGQYNSNSSHRKVFTFSHEAYSPAPKDTEGLPINDAVLKAYIPQYDFFVYQRGNKLIWLIGTDIKPNTEIIYHLTTNRIDLLPEHRIKYRFDSRGIMVYSNSSKKYLGKYLVYEKDIPTEYPIEYIRSGLYDLKTKKAIKTGYFTVD